MHDTNGEKFGDISDFYRSRVRLEKAVWITENFVARLLVKTDSSDSSPTDST